MKTKYWVFAVFLEVITLLIPQMSVWAQTQQKEDLLFVDVPVVFTASRREQPITESPSTITVITSEDIFCSGATTIPDVLRMVAGLDVMAITARDQQVSIRGFNTSQSNKLLVLVDGRSVYKDLYGSIFWDLFPIGLDDIERIEVIKSPVSSLYGANAYCGVINIITKMPEQPSNTRLKFIGGNYNTFIGSLFHSGAGKRFSYKLSTEWDRTQEWQGGNDAGQIFKLYGLLRYHMDKLGTITLSAGRIKTKDRKLFVDYQLGSLNFEGLLDYLQLDYKVGNFSLRSFYNRMDVNVDLYQASISHVGHTYTFDVEMLHNFKIKNTHSVVWGLNFRNNIIEKSYFFDQTHNQNLWALFFEDEIKLTEQLRFSLGGRYDWHPLVKEHFSPRGNLVYAPAKDHILRFSATKAYRNPAFINSYLSLDVHLELPVPGVQPPMMAPFVYSNHGNANLKSEGIVAYELGYLWFIKKGIQLNVNLFYNQYSHLFLTTDSLVVYGANELFPGSPGGCIPKVLTKGFTNGGDAHGMGGEISLDLKFNKRISGFINYAFLRIIDDDDLPTTPLINEKNRIKPEYPEHKINMGFRVKLRNGFSLNLLGHWVSQTKHDIQYNYKEQLITIKDYLLINPRVGYSLSPNGLELSLGIFNLFNNVHYEYPAGIVTTPAFSHPLGRKVTFALTYSF